MTIASFLLFFFLNLLFFLYICTKNIQYMKVLFVTDAFAVWGGMERVLADKMNYLAERYDNKIILLTINQGNHSIPFPLHSQIKHVNLDINMHQQYAYHGIRRLQKRWQLKHLLKNKLNSFLQQINVDIISCVKLDFVGTLNQVRGSIPLVVESHTMCKAEKIEEAGWLRRLNVWNFKQHVRKANAVVALTKDDANDWRKYNRQVWVVPNVVHLNNSNNLSSHNEKRVIFVGRNSKQKDLDSLLRIWSIVYSRHSDWTLDIYTDCEIDAPGVSVFKPVANIMEPYCKSSMIVLTSLFEPFGLVMPEAMSCGLPVVAFDCPYGPADIITNGVDGFLIKNRDVDEFANRVCQLMEDNDLRIRMGQAAVKASQRYRADAIMPKWKDLFERLCQKE